MRTLGSLQRSEGRHRGNGTVLIVIGAVQSGDGGAAARMLVRGVIGPLGGRCVVWSVHGDVDVLLNVNR